MPGAGYVALAIFLTVILFLGASAVAARVFADAGRRLRFRIKTAALIVGWLVYVSLISLSGFLENNSLPPRIPLLLVLPAFAFIIYFFASGKFRAVIENTPASWPVYFQSFRIIVELLIWGSVLNGILPRAASFEGYNFDIVIGIAAPLVGFALIKNGSVKNKSLLLVWNIAGFITLGIVVFILISGAYFFTMWGQTESILSKGFGLFPYTFLAGFFMPLAVFMHIFSIIKIRTTK